VTAANSSAGPRARPEQPSTGIGTGAKDRDWDAELDRITFTYRCVGWAIAKNLTRPGYIAQRTGWDGATVTIGAPDMITLETRLRNQADQDREHRLRHF